jgi:catechol 2,3-dioxygenase-like lactoylglutathione lyase family enzyme
MSGFIVEKINHVGIPTEDRRKSIAFFRDLIGLEVIPHEIDGNPLVWTRAQDGTMVHLIEPTDGNSAGFHVALQVDDIDAALKTIKASGIEITSGPGVRHNGQRYFFVEDPDGNRIEIATAGYTIDSERTVDELGYTYDKDGNKL